MHNNRRKLSEVAIQVFKVENLPCYQPPLTTNNPEWWKKKRKEPTTQQTFSPLLFPLLYILWSGKEIGKICWTTKKVKKSKSSQCHFFELVSRFLLTRRLVSITLQHQLRGFELVLEFNIFLYYSVRTQELWPSGKIHATRIARNILNFMKTYKC